MSGLFSNKGWLIFKLLLLSDIYWLKQKYFIILYLNNNSGICWLLLKSY